MIDIVCSPTPFLIGLLSSSLPRLKELPVEEVLVVDLVNNRFLRQMEDEDSILPRKLQAALEHILEQRNELASDKEEGPVNGKQETSPLNEVVSEAFVRFFVEIVGHYSLFLTPTEREERTLQREAFRKSVSSKSLRRFLEVFMETQMFGGFIQERELRKQGVRGSKMKFLHKKSQQPWAQPGHARTDVWCRRKSWRLRGCRDRFLDIYSTMHWTKHSLNSLH
ncbi:hypothetical protein llap_13627 [Limosa lapponica baueri]|uniref:UDENN domain-containing protein n=1 Tax=Limosa lapponica baueri TaxID=1758121 RepID=A0A2I0TQJ1_LIMLA|nr:hypothetical protein llap_13627 [Limosa lapponica baueri]